MLDKQNLQGRTQVHLGDEWEIAPLMAHLFPHYHPTLQVNIKTFKSYCKKENKFLFQ